VNIVFEYADRFELRRKQQWQDDLIIIPWRTPCHIRILMVADFGSFGTGQGYDLSRVLEAIQHDLPSYVRIDVTKARHASAGVIDDPTADIIDLRFHEHDLTMYDQIWIFAVSPGDGAMEKGEVGALWKFMQNGGGVFATGDHEDLGVAMCGAIPRVRSMRRWHFPSPGPNGEPVAPAGNASDGRGENDSTTSPDGTEFDGVPQTIQPVMYSAASGYVFAGKAYPHPLLCSKKSPITQLPDHMHEGAIEVPADLERPITVEGEPVEEYPRAGANRLAPEVIARSSISNNPAGKPFGVIGAYDGHQVDELRGGVGRVVVDATWHHFWNYNVEQFASAHDAFVQAVANGVAPDPAWYVPAAAWEQMRDYFQNIAFWLARKSTQACIRRRALWYLTYHLDVQMALKSSRVDRIASLMAIGAKARDALQQIAPQCERLRIIWDPSIFEELIPWIPIPDPFKPQVPLLRATLVEDLVLGALVEAMAQGTASANAPEELAKLLVDEPLDAELAQAARGAVALLAKRLEHDAERLRQMGAAAAKR